MSADVDRFRQVIIRWTGLTLHATPPDLLEALLAERAAASGTSPGTYLDRLEADRCRSELAALAPRLTVPETYFFRNSEQFRALVDIASSVAIEEALEPRTLGGASRRQHRDGRIHSVGRFAALIPGEPIAVTVA